MSTEAETTETGATHWIGPVLRVGPWVLATALLLLPLAAMQFTDEVDWGPEDFTVIGVLLFGGCGLYELAARRTRSVAHRLAVGLAIGTAFLLIWVNLAVGIIGAEDESANLLYGAVLGVGVLGAAVVRGRARGMALVLAAMAAAQLLIGGAALVLGWGAEGGNWPQVIILANGVFAALWLASAGLFRLAAQAAPAAG